MILRIRLFIIVLFATASAYAQQVDSLIYAVGKIINAETKEEISARISYHSLPYGNRVGVINNSAYSFPMFDQEKYSIIVEAPGFQSAKYMLDPAEANGDNQVIQNIELSIAAAGGSGHAAGQVLVLKNLIFEMSKAKINPESYTELDLVVNMMNENKDMIIQLEGHTDYLGDAKQNMKLSESRVKAVKQYLVEKKIPRHRIKTKAFGGTMPLSQDDTPQAHSLNRRVEVRILEN
jgi:outer membrane protein OmpA-like peptidoglycan-associated protein